MDIPKKNTVFISGNSDPIPGTESRTKGMFFFAVILSLIFILGCAIGSGFWFFRHMYQTLLSPEEIQNIQQPLVSCVFARDGSLIHEFHIERRFWVPLDEIPENLQNAVIATEDRRFYRHWGIDFKRIVGAVCIDLLRGHYAQGASTITQQLARNLYLSFRQSMIRKIREAMTAVQMETYYTKKQILELYLNQVYLGAGVYGVEAAAQKYFSKPVADLDINECSILAGMIQLPEHYRPDRPENMKRIQTRRKAVIAAMKKADYITEQKAGAVLLEDIPSNPEINTSKVAPYFIEVVRDYIEKKYGENPLYNGGLNIYTTLDPVAQKAAEDTMAIHLKSMQMVTNRIFLDSSKAHVALHMPKDTFLAHFDSLYDLRRDEYKSLPDSSCLRIVQASVVALDIKTGGVLVLIGGRDFLESKFNRALMARRQPGSSFKPFVYLTALDSGYTPSTVVLDQPVTLETSEGLWRPENYDREFLGPVTVRTALKKSINLVAIQVIRDIGPENVIARARQMGFKHDMNPVPALAVGACQATPMEMAVAYSIFADHGRMTEPYFIDSIIDKNGKLIEKHKHKETSVFSPQKAFIMTSLLRSVVTGGTGASIPASGFTRPAAGKTGTTNDYSDAWFVGFTPQISCAVWVGVDERLSMGRGVTGAKGAIPIWIKTMKTLHRSLPVANFSVPAGIVMRRVCSKTNKLASAYCPQYYEEYFIESSLPDTCDIHGLGRGKKSDNVLEMFSTKKRSPSKDGKKRRKSLTF